MFQNYNMYGINNYPTYYRSDNINNWMGEIISLDEAINMIKDSVNDEKSDEDFYSNIISKAPSEKDKLILNSIKDDEIKHGKILRQIYFEFTGKTISNDNISTTSVNNLDYKQALEKALFGELDAVSKYRKILGTMPSGKYYTLIMSILTDEIRHACKYNFLIQNNN